MTSDTKDPIRGRPRDDERTEVILETTSRLLRQKGWNDLRVQDVATEAKCGLATIYRRWETKEELVAASLVHRALPTIEFTGEADTDLRRLIMAVAADTAEMGRTLIDFFAAANRSDTLRSAVIGSAVGDARPQISKLLYELLSPDNPHVDFLVDAIAGSMIFRVGVLGETWTPEEVTEEFMLLVYRLQ